MLAPEHRKLCKRFSRSLVKLAIENEWEENSLGDLIYLLSKLLELKPKSTLKFMKKCDLLSALVLSQILDHGDVMISSDQIVKFLVDSAIDHSEFSTALEETLEQGIVKPDDHIVELIRDLIIDSCTSIEYSKLARTLCSHANSKRECGRILCTLTATMTIAEAAHFIADIVTFDFFEDLEGEMKYFFRELREWGDQDVGCLETMVRSVLSTISENGHIPDSDEDDDGNLLGFIVADEGDDVSTQGQLELESDENSFHESDEDNESEHSGVEVFSDVASDDDSQANYDDGPAGSASGGSEGEYSPGEGSEVLGYRTSGDYPDEYLSDDPSEGLGNPTQAAGYLLERSKEHRGPVAPSQPPQLRREVVAERGSRSRRMPLAEQITREPPPLPTTYTIRKRRRVVVDEWDDEEEGQGAAGAVKSVRDGCDVRGTDLSLPQDTMGAAVDTGEVRIKEESLEMKSGEVRIKTEKVNTEDGEGPFLVSAVYGINSTDEGVDAEGSRKRRKKGKKRKSIPLISSQ